MVNDFIINAMTNSLDADWKTLRLHFSKTTLHAKKSSTLSPSICSDFGMHAGHPYYILYQPGTAESRRQRASLRNDFPDTLPWSGKLYSNNSLTGFS